MNEQHSSSGFNKNPDKVLSLTLCNKSSVDVETLVLSASRLDSIVSQRVSHRLLVGRKRRFQLSPDAEIWKLSLSQKDYTGLWFDSRTKPVNNGLTMDLCAFQPSRAVWRA